jgi:N-acetylglucosamine-6-phosphate deacetylase
MLLGGMRLVTDLGVVDDAWLAITDQRVTATGSGLAPGMVDVDLGGLIVTPGFIDLHCHGGGGASYDEGDPDEVAAGVSFHRRHGTTATLASTVSGHRDHLTSQVKLLAECHRAGMIEGIHLEGPYLATSRCGAQDPAALRDPDLDELTSFIDAGEQAVRMVTLAPERKGALEAIALLRSRGVLAAVGHTDATYEQAIAAIEAGATVATHLGNACRPIHHRNPGALLALLEDDRVTCELILDGVHLHPHFASFCTRTIGADRTALVTDAIVAAGMADGPYRLGRVEVDVSGGQARVQSSGALAGSTLTTDVAFRRAVHLHGLTLPQASQAASGNPARLIGRSDLGHLRPGARADLVVLDEELRLRRVLAAGAWIDGVTAEGGR